MNRKHRDFVFRPIVLIGLSVALFAFKVHAGPGHGESEVSQVQGDAPKRQSDGTSIALLRDARLKRTQ